MSNLQGCLKKKNAVVEKFDAIWFPVLTCDMLSMEEFELLCLVLDILNFVVNPDTYILYHSFFRLLQSENSSSSILITFLILLLIFKI